MVTLEMTRAGKNMVHLTKDLPWEESIKYWQRISAAFARGAKGTVHVFHNATDGVGVNSVWRTVEYGILKAKKVKIVYHNVHYCK